MTGLFGIALILQGAMVLLVWMGAAVMAARAEKAVPTEIDPAACLEACIQLVRTDVQAEKARLVAANLVLTDKEAEQFWPMYRKYDVEITEINDRIVAALKEYSEAGGVYTDERAAELLGEWFDIQDQKMRVRRHYSKQFRQIIPSAKVTRFFQIDNRIDLALQLQIASGLPLLQRAGGN